MVLGCLEMVRCMAPRTVVGGVAFHQSGVQTLYERSNQICVEMIGVAFLSERELHADLACGTTVERVVDLQKVFRIDILDEIHSGDRVGSCRSHLLSVCRKGGGNQSQPQRQFSDCCLNIHVLMIYSIR